MKYTWKICFSLLFLFTVLLHFNQDFGYQATASSDNAIKLPILMYHKISERSTSWGKYSISPVELESDIKLILAEGFTPITISQLIDYQNNTGTLPEKPIMLTFDDGNRSDYIYAFPLAKKYGIKIVCSTVGAYTEEYSNTNDHNVNYAYLSWDEMREMQDSGNVEFQNHSYNLHSFDENRHGALKSSSETDEEYQAMIRHDLSRSQQLFRENGLKVPTCFTYPYGMRDDALLNLVQEEAFLASLGTYERVNILGHNLYDLCRFNRPHKYNIQKILDMAK